MKKEKEIFNMKNLREDNRKISTGAIAQIKEELKTGRQMEDLPTEILKNALISRVKKKAIEGFMSEDTIIPSDMTDRVRPAGRVYVEVLVELQRRAGYTGENASITPDFMTDEVNEQAGYFIHDGIKYQATDEDFVKAWADPKNYTLITYHREPDSESCQRFKIAEAERRNRVWETYIRESASLLKQHFIQEIENQDPDHEDAPVWVGASLWVQKDTDQEDVADIVINCMTEEEDRREVESMIETMRESKSRPYTEATKRAIDSYRAKELMGIPDQQAEVEEDDDAWFASLYGTDEDSDCEDDVWD